jgi:AbrB family looped-hinge helix DNA binding protein
MSTSTISSKGQTTIPKNVRRALKLKPKDKITYIIEGNKVIMLPFKGNVLGLRGSIKQQNEKIDFKKLRAETKKRVARRITEKE